MTNEVGEPTQKFAINLIKAAITEGIQCIDTAPTYGDSEQNIGQVLREGWSDRVRVITKLPPFEYKYEPSDIHLRSKIKLSALMSLYHLQSKYLDTLMMHRASNIRNKHIVEELKSLKKDGWIKNIGVSIQTHEELKLALDQDYVSIIQMPFNILDHRWDNLIPIIKTVKKCRDLEIQVRSVFLQGLLGTDDVAYWDKAKIENPSAIINWLKMQQKYLRMDSIVEPEFTLYYFAILGRCLCDWL